MGAERDARAAPRCFRLQKAGAREEVEALDKQIASKKDEFKSLATRANSFESGNKELDKVEQALEFNEAFQLPEPTALMSAKTYKTKFAEPLVKKLKSLVKKALARCFEVLDSYHRLNADNGRLYRENERLRKVNDRLKDENENLLVENKDYKLLRKGFGSGQIDDLLVQAWAAQQSKQREKRYRNNQNER